MTENSDGQIDGDKIGDPADPLDMPTVRPEPIEEPQRANQGLENSAANDDATLPPQSRELHPPEPPPADEATLPPTNERRAGQPGQQDLDTLPQQQTSWRSGGTVRYFGDYELLSEIARGGMGVVYRARQSTLNRIVALKMILAGQLAGEDEVQRFHAEAEAAAKLDHPGIVPIFEVGEYEGQHYFSMGYVDGSSLSDLIAEQPLEPREAATLTLRIAEAIGYAHDQGVIHRDLKPANVLVQQRAVANDSKPSLKSSTISGSAANGSALLPRVTDFGLAKQLQGDDQLTASGQILGTPSYMPPEQAAGKSDQIDHRSDIYSLGGILYALITGRPPFQAANQLDTLMQVLEKEPVPPRQLDPQLPKDIETIALKALEKDPRRRYQTAAELAEDLQRFLHGEPILARSITRVERAWRWAKRKPVIAGLGALAAALLLIVSIGGPTVAIQQSALRSLAEDREAEATQAKLAAENAAELEKAARRQAVQASSALAKEKERAERTLYARTIALAYQEWHNDNVHRAEDLLNKTNHEYRDWEWHFVKKLCNSEEQTLRGHAGIPFRMRLSPDGKRLVSLGGVSLAVIADGNVYVWDVQAGTVLKKLPYRGFAISPDAQRVAVETTNDGPVVIMDVTTDKQIALIPAHAGGTAWANFNSDGTRLVTTGPDQAVRIWDATTGDKVLEITDQARRLVHDVNFSNDDKYLVWKTFDGLIQIYDATTGKKVKEIEDRLYRNDAVDVAISPDNQILAAASNGPIHLFDMQTGEKIDSLYGHRSSVLGLCFSPDGRRLASCGVDGTVRVWDVQERREAFRFRGHKFGVQYGVHEVIYSDDGNWIISGGSDATIKIWPADAGDGFAREQALAAADDVDIVEAASVYPDPSQEKDWLVGSLNYVDAVAFSPDGKLAATASEDDSVHVYDLATRENVFTFTDHEQNVAAVAFHPDEPLIASGEGGLNDNRNGKIFVWDRSTGKRKSTLIGHGGPICDLLYNADGTILYSATGSQAVSHRGEVFAWDIAGEKLVFKYEDIKGVRDLDLSPDGKLLAVASYGGPIQLLDTSNGQLVREIGGEGEVFYAVAFSKDGQHLATGKRNWAMSVWDLQSGNRLWEKIDHTGVIMGVAFNPSGTRVISSSVDRSTKVWDASSGDMLLDLRGDAFELFGVAISPDGNTVASFGEAPYVTLRDLGSDASSAAIATSEQQWPVIFSDDFQRAELGERWTAENGTWEIEDGAAKGTLAGLPSIPGFYATTLVPKAWLPSTVEIEFDAWAPEQVLFETKLHDESVQNGIGSLFLATHLPFFNQARQGGSIIVQAQGGFNEVARTGAANWFKPNQKYRLKTIRRRGNWEMFIDGKPVLQGDVPDSMWLPVLHIQGSFAEPGTILYVDNVVIRAPESTADEIAATGLEWDLRQELKLTSLVIDRLEHNEDITPAVRQLAVEYAKRHPEDPQQRQQVIREIVLNRDQQNVDDYRPLIELLERELKENQNDWKLQQFLAAANFRAGQFEQALAALKGAEAEFQKAAAMSHPVHMALLAMTASAMNDPERVNLAMDRLTELMRSDYWQSDEDAVAWTQQANEMVQRPAPADPALAKEIETIKQVTFDPQQEALCQYRIDNRLASFTDDAIHIEGRSDTPNQYDVEVSQEEWAAASRVFCTGAPPLHCHFVRSRVDVTIDGDQAVLKGNYTAAIPIAHWRWESEERLRKTDAGWKIYWRRHGLTGFQINGKTLVSSPADWPKLDAEVQRVRENDQPMALIRPLVAARHLQEAYDTVKKLSEQPDAPVEIWRAVADRAHAVSNAAEMLRAGKKAVQLKPEIGGAPFIRALAVEEHLPEQPLEVGHGIRVQTPTFVTEAPSRDFSVPGTALRAWYPSDRSALVVFYAEDAKEFDTLQEGMAALAAQFKAAANVKIHRLEASELAGMQAVDLIMQGDGNGRNMAVGTVPKGSAGTVQRWVVTARGNALIGMLLTAATNEFDQRNAEFETWLKYVEIDAD